MGDFLPTGHPQLGELRIETVIEYFDAPVMFVARNELGFPFLCLAVEEIDEDTIYLYVPMSEQRLQAVRTGLVSLREAISGPETSSVLTVTVRTDDGPPAVRGLPTNWIPTEWLPDEGERLSEPLETATPFSPGDLGTAAVRENRHLIALEVDTPASFTRTELPLRASGPIMTEFQELADSLANDSDFALVDLQAASFVIVLAPVVGDGLFGAPSPALQRILDLLEAAAGDSFGEYLTELNRRRKAHVRDFFSTLSDAGTGLVVFSASPSGGVVQKPLSLERLRGGLQMLRASNELESETLDITGYLIAINHARRSFGVREAWPSGGRKKPRHISGKFEPFIDIEGIASGQTVLYRFAILREAQAPEFDESEVKYVHRMLAMELLEAEP